MIFANQSSVMDDIYYAYMRKQRFFHTWTGLANTRKGFRCFLKRYPKKQKPRWSVHQLRKNLKQIFLNFLNFFSRKTKKFSQIESGTTSVFFALCKPKESRANKMRSVFERVQREIFEESDKKSCILGHKN